MTLIPDWMTLCPIHERPLVVPPPKVGATPYCMDCHMEQVVYKAQYINPAAHVRRLQETLAADAHPDPLPTDPFVHPWDHCLPDSDMEEPAS